MPLAANPVEGVLPVLATSGSLPNNKCPLQEAKPQQLRTSQILPLEARPERATVLFSEALKKDGVKVIRFLGAGGETAVISGCEMA